MRYNAHGLATGTTSWLVRFGYDGAGFGGWARQPGRRTVEGEIDHGIARRRLPIGRAPLAVASRTDRGVSARANAVILTSRLPAPSLLRALNGLAPEIFFTAATSVPEGFRVRGATRRVYRYFDASQALRPDRWPEAARLLVGEVDVRSFGRSLPTHSPVRRTIESVRVLPWPSGRMVEVSAPSFVWGMVRKIVGALREVDAGHLSLSQLRSACEGRERLTLPMVEPEPLVLWDVEFPLAWSERWSGPNRHQRQAWERARSGALSRHGVLEALMEGESE